MTRGAVTGRPNRSTPSTGAADDKLTIDRMTLQIVFDTAVQGMDFGSGFLDDEEVEALRRLAVFLGVDPMVATPYNFTCKYTGEHTKVGEDGVCWRCRQPVPQTGGTP